MDFQPHKLLKSRYALANINSNNYTSFSNVFSGCTSLTSITLPSGITNQGYIFAPYLIVDLPPIWYDREWEKHKLLQNRKDKFIKLGW